MVRDLVYGGFEVTISKTKMEVSQRAREMPRSSIRRLFNAARALEASGREVIRLDIGDPDFALPGRIAEGIREALGGGHTHYSPMPGIRPLREAVVRHLRDRKGVSCPADEVVVCQGATQALHAATLLTCDPGDTMLVPQIYWPNVMQQLTLTGVRPRFYPLGDDFQPRLEALDGLDLSGARSILINSPGNPTGALFPPETVRALHRFAAEHDLWIVSDEAYTDYVFDGPHLSPLELDRTLPAEQRRVIGVFSFSKSFAATGLRMGWTVSPTAAAAAAMAFLNEPLTGSLTTPLQWGMVRALEEDDTAARRDSLRRRRDLAARLLDEAGVETPLPAGGLFFFVDIGVTGLTGDEFADRLLAEQGVAVVPGSGFGLRPAAKGGYEPDPLADRCVRLCFAVASESLEEGVRRFGKMMIASETGRSTPKSEGELTTRPPR